MVFLKEFKATEVDVYVRYRTSGNLFNLRRSNAVNQTFITLIKDLLYADDCDLVCHSVADMQLPMDCFSSVFTEFGLSSRGK